MIPDNATLKAAYSNAPEDVKEFITSDEYAHVFEELRTTHKLHLDEAGKLSNAINAVFLQLASFEEFPKLVKEALQQGQSSYDSILKEVNEKLFIVFRNKIAKTTTAPQINELHKSSAPAQGYKQEPSNVSKERLPSNKLNQVVHEKATDITVENTSSESANTSTQTTSQYTGGGGDPYREPIE